MSDSEDEENLPFERSSIGAIGARRRWRLFGNRTEGRGTGESGNDQGKARAGGDADGRITHSMLGDLASRVPASLPAESSPPPARPAKEASAESAPITRSMLDSLASRNASPPSPEPARRSLLSLEGASGSPDEDAAELSPGPGGLTAHSTLGELAGLESHPAGTFPIERGILISIVMHVLLVILLFTVPTRIPADKDFFALPESPTTETIPINFQDVPGQSRPNPKRSPLSDADRRASGGDPSKPKSQTPFVAPSPGVANLAPGPRAPRVAGSQGGARSGTAAEQRAAAEKSEQLSEQKPSEFPTDMRPQMGKNPREISRLAGLDRAIEEAAKGAVGGEGGSPATNEEGGFVDSGPISFDSSWYDWGPYAAEMIRRIKLHWDVPELARLGWKGSLTVRFYILADGRVAEARILRTSGIPPFDFAAFQAILKSSPFRPLPSDLHEEHEGITVTFFYNLRPEDEEAKTQPKPAKSP